MEKQITKSQGIISNFKTEKSTEIASSVSYFKLFLIFSLLITTSLLSERIIL